MDKLWYLSRISIFEALPEEDLLEIDRMAPMTHFNTLPKGIMVQTPDYHREGLFFVQEGKLRIYKINADGKQFTAGILGAGKRPQLAMKFLKELSDRLKERDELLEKLPLGTIRESHDSC